jgi:hypothetical protein
MSRNPRAFYNTNRSEFSILRAGCLTQLAVWALFTVASKFGITYSLGVWFGAEVVSKWEATNIVVQWLVAAVAAGVAIPVTVVSFFASLITPTPIF